MRVGRTWPRRLPVVSAHLGMGLSSSGSHIIYSSTTFNQRAKGGLVVEGGMRTGVPRRSQYEAFRRVLSRSPQWELKDQRDSVARYWDYPCAS